MAPAKLTYVQAVICRKGIQRMLGQMEGKKVTLLTREKVSRLNLEIWLNTQPKMQII